MRWFIRGLIKLKKLYIYHIKRRFLNAKIRMQACSVGQQLKVNFRSRVNSKTVLGNNVNFNGLTINGHGEVIIGDNFHSGTDCLLITDFHNYDHGTKIPYDSTSISKSIVIEDNVWLGSRIIILGGVTIGEGAIIQAGSVVTKDIPKYAIAGGHPAKVFKSRNIEHYLNLKSKNYFH